MASRRRRVWKILGLSTLILIGLLGGILLYVLRFPQNYFRSEWVASWILKQDFARNWDWKHFDVEVNSNRFLEYKVSLDIRDFQLNYIGESEEFYIDGRELRSEYLISLKLSGFSFDIDYLALAALIVNLNSLKIREISDAKEKTVDEVMINSKLLWKEFFPKLWSGLVKEPKLSVKEVLFENKDSSIKTRLENIVIDQETSENFSIKGKAFPFAREENSPSVDLNLKLTKSTATLDFELIEKTKFIPGIDSPSCEMEISLLDKIEEFSPLNLNCRIKYKTPDTTWSRSLKSNVDLELKTSIAPDLNEKLLNGISLLLSTQAKVLNIEMKLEHANELDVFNLKLSELIKILAPQIKGQIEISDLNLFLKNLSPTYREFPAPFNVMNGNINIKVETKIQDELMQSNAKLHLEMSGVEQRIDIETSLNVPWTYVDQKGFVWETPQLDVMLHSLALVLPRINPRESLPMLVSDARFKKSEAEMNENSDKLTDASKLKQQTHLKKDQKWLLNLATEKSIVLKTSLLESDLRIGLSLKISELGIEEGFVEVLPIKMEILKRPIELEELRLVWTSLSSSNMIGRILFKLPEYQIFLKLEGPIDSPRYAFESKPPLSTDDIYSVLLFGQPMTELDPEGRQGMARVRQGLAQGLFSLSTLYLLAGSRIESLGYNPDSSEVSASVRLDKKHSVRLGASEGGRESVALRRSLGGGWFVESKAQQTSSQADDQHDFGLMLQRVIAY